jgi:hypothetical protein
MKSGIQEDNTMNDTFSTIGEKFSAEDFMKFINMLDETPVMIEIKFSKEYCELKEKYFKRFPELPTKESTSIYGGILIKESEMLPPNTMAWCFSDGSVRIFFYRDGNLYEMPNKFMVSQFNLETK